MNTGTLYIIATPIGNLRDITYRAIEVLGKVDFVICEDTRHTKKLLQHYRIAPKLISWHQHSSPLRTEKILQALSQGASAGLVTDAGTPGISDPGNKLVAEARKQGITVTPIPGPSALTAALSVAGFAVDRFTFFGFLPIKKGRRKFLEKIQYNDFPSVFFESPHRILRTLASLDEVLGSEREVVVARELTKKFESLYSGNIQEVRAQLEKDILKGEFVVIIK